MAGKRMFAKSIIGSDHFGICHNDEKAFMDKYHLEPVKIDEKIAKKYRLKQ